MPEHIKMKVFQINKHKAFSAFIKFQRILIIGFVLITIGLHKGKLINLDLFSKEGNQVKIASFEMEDVTRLFPLATSIKGEDSITVLQENKKIGWLINSSPALDSVVGFSSSVPLLIGFDSSNKIIGVHLLKNEESPEFVKAITQSKLLKSWNGIAVNNYNKTISLDGISGATETSSAIIKTVNGRIAHYQNVKPARINEISYWEIIQYIMGAIIIILGLIQFFHPQKLRKYRLYYQLSSVLILGFLMGSFISTASLFNWIVFGISLPSKLFMLILLMLSIGLPLFTGKSFYCTHICPYGAMQDLMGKITKRRIKLSFRVKSYLSSLREIIFSTIVFLLTLGVGIDLTNVEPFSAFLFQSASIPILVLSIFFIILSLFMPRPWCNYCCPTGQFLEIFRKPVKTNSNENK